MATENSDDIRLIVKIAQLAYEQDMTQAQNRPRAGYLSHHDQPVTKTWTRAGYRHHRH